MRNIAFVLLVHFVGFETFDYIPNLNAAMFKRGFNLTLSRSRVLLDETFTIKTNYLATKVEFFGKSVLEIEIIEMKRWIVVKTMVKFIRNTFSLNYFVTLSLHMFSCYSKFSGDLRWYCHCFLLQMFYRRDGRSQLLCWLHKCRVKLKVCWICLYRNYSFE